MSLFDRVVVEDEQRAAAGSLTEARVTQVEVYSPTDLQYGLEDLRTGLDRWIADRQGRASGKGHEMIEAPLKKMGEAMTAAVDAAKVLKKTWSEHYY